MPWCSACGCANRTEKGFKVYKFPSNLERRKIWRDKVKRLGWEPSSGSYICEVCVLIVCVITLCRQGRQVCPFKDSLSYLRFSCPQVFRKRGQPEKCPFLSVFKNFYWFLGYHIIVSHNSMFRNNN